MLSLCWLLNCIAPVLMRYGRNERLECSNCAKILLRLPHGKACVTHNNTFCVHFQSWIKLVWTFACFLSRPLSLVQVWEIKMCQERRRVSLPQVWCHTDTERPRSNYKHFSHRLGQQTSFNLRCISVLYTSAGLVCSPQTSLFISTVIVYVS